MPNTYTDLPDVAADMAVTTLGTRLAPLSAVANDFSDQLVDLTRPVILTVVTDAGTAGEASANQNFETGDSTTAPVSLAAKHIFKSFHITQAERNKGRKLEDLFKKNLQVFANKSMDLILADATVANCGAAHVAATSLDLSITDLKTIRGEIKDVDDASLILDGAYLAQHAPSDKNGFELAQSGAYGYNRVVANNRWDGAGTGVIGMALDKSGFASASALPDHQINSMIAQEVINIENIDLDIQFNLWESTATRKLWGSFDVVIGGALVDAAKVKLIATA